MPRPSPNLRTCLAAILLFAGSPLSAAEPQATFALFEGELEISIQQDGVGVKDASVRVIDLGGNVLIEGECDDDGRGSIPLEFRPTYLVGISIPGKKKESDLITLRSDGKTITPPRVLVSFSKPCCRVTFSSQSDGDEFEDDAPRPERRSFAWIMLGVSGGCMLAAGMMLMLFRRP